VSTKKRKGFLRYLVIAWIVAVTIGAFIPLANFISREILPRILPEKPEVVVDIIHLSPSDQREELQRILAQRDFEDIMKKQIWIPLVLKIANPSRNHVVVTSVQVTCESDEVIVRREIPIEIYKIDRKSEVRECIILDDIQGTQTQYTHFPLLIESGHAKMVKIYTVFDTTMLSMSESEITHAEYVLPIRQINVRVVFSEKESKILNLGNEDIPFWCKGGMSVGIGEEAKESILEEHEKQIQEILEALGPDENSVTKVTIVETFSVDSLGSPYMDTKYEIEFTKGGVLKKLKLGGREVDEMIR